MNLTTTARHCTLDPGDREFASLRLEKIARFLREPQRDRLECHLVVTAAKNRHEAEITLRVLRHELVSREDGLDARAAIELAADQLEQQMRRLKERAVHQRKGGRERVADGGAAIDGVADGAADDGIDWFDGTDGE